METISSKTGACPFTDCFKRFPDVMMFRLSGVVHQGYGAMQPALFFRDVKVVVDEDALVHLVGFATPDGESKSERRPVAHFVMSNETFRRLLADGRVSLAKGGH